jgi:hypothetical protein
MRPERVGCLKIESGRDVSCPAQAGHPASAAALDRPVKPGDDKRQETGLFEN